MSLTGILTGDENTEVSVDGVTKPSMAKAISDKFTELLIGQRSGVIVFTNHALLDAYTPTIEQQTSSFKVTNDPMPSKNGYYHWVSGTAYAKDANLSDGVIEPGNVDAVSGGTVSEYTYGKEHTDNMYAEVTKTKASTEAIPSIAVKMESLVKTNDNYSVIETDGDVINIGGTYIKFNDGFSALTITTEDGFTLLKVSHNGDVELSGTSHEISYLGGYSITTSDGYELIGFDADNGAASLSIGGERFEFSADGSVVKGALPTGIVTDIRARGDWFAYNVASKFCTGKVIGKNTEDWATPHIADSSVFQVWEADGQSWQTIGSYNASDTIYEDATGYTREAIKNAISPMVSTLRKLNSVGVEYVEGDNAGQVPTISNNTSIGELYRHIPEYGYSIARIGAICYTVQCKALGVGCLPVVNLQVGWPGTSSDKFLPDGSSYIYIDDDGVSQTTMASPHPDLGGGTEYLWDRNVVQRNGLRDMIKDKWRGKKLAYNFLSWIQGPFNDYGNALGFMEEYRVQQDLLSIPDFSGKRTILWDQNGGTSSSMTKPKGVQATVDFCQANSSGSDFLVGPRYPHKLYDYIHHSSNGALEYAERTGQCAAYIEAYGTWQPLWITNVSISGSTITITTNAPAQTDGKLAIDKTIGNAADLGFTIVDSVGIDIGITSVNITGNNEITIVTSTVLGGDIEVRYATKSNYTNPDGTVEVPSISATIGNIKMKGLDDNAIVPKNISRTLDHWLCAHIKTYSI